MLKKIVSTLIILIQTAYTATQKPSIIYKTDDASWSQFADHVANISLKHIRKTKSYYRVDPVHETHHESFFIVGNTLHGTFIARVYPELKKQTHHIIPIAPEKVVTFLLACGYEEQYFFADDDPYLPPHIIKPRKFAGWGFLSEQNTFTVNENNGHYFKRTFSIHKTKKEISIKIHDFRNAPIKIKCTANEDPHLMLIACGLSKLFRTNIYAKTYVTESSYTFLDEHAPAFYRTFSISFHTINDDPIKYVRIKLKSDTPEKTDCDIIQAFLSTQNYSSPSRREAADSFANKFIAVCRDFCVIENPYKTMPTITVTGPDIIPE